MEMMDVLLEILYVLCGIVALITAYTAFTDSSNKARYGTAAFWLIVATTFMLGKVFTSRSNWNTSCCIRIINYYKTSKLWKHERVFRRI